MHTAQDVMSSPLIMTDAQATVAEAVGVMRRHHVSSLLVRPTGSAKHYGIITKRDVVTKLVAHNTDLHGVAVADVMTGPLTTAAPDYTLVECSRIMSEKNIRRLPVFVGSTPVGIVSDTDIFAAVEESGWGNPA